MLKLMFSLVDMSGIFEGCLLALTRSRLYVYSRTKTVIMFSHDEIGIMPDCAEIVQRKYVVH